MNKTERIFLCVLMQKNLYEGIIKDTEEITWAIGMMTIKIKSKALDLREKGKVLVLVEVNICRCPGRKFQPKVGGSHLRIRGNQEWGVREEGEYVIAEGPAVLGDYRLIMAQILQLGSDV